MSGASNDIELKAADAAEADKADEAGESVESAAPEDEGEALAPENAADPDPDESFDEAVHAQTADEPVPDDAAEAAEPVEAAESTDFDKDVSEPEPVEAAEELAIEAEEPAEAARVEAEPGDALDDGSNFASIGAQLAAARAARNLSLEDVADAIRVRREYLDAIEAMDPRRLPHGPYAAGFVRTYAAHLGLNAERATARFREEMSPRRSIREYEAPKQKRERKLNVRALTFIGAAGAVTAVAWFGLQPRAEIEVDAVPPVPEALEAWVRADPGADGARLLAELEAAEGPAISLAARVPVRIEITGPGGEILFADILRMDASYEVPQRAGLTIAARNAGAVEVFRDGDSMGRMGRSGVPVQGWSVDEARRARPVENLPLVEAEGEAPVEVVATPVRVEESLPVSRILSEPLPTALAESNVAGSGPGAPPSSGSARSDSGLPESRIFAPGTAPAGFGSVSVEELPPIEAAPEEDVAADNPADGD